jgi:DNA-binding CsgD family transcriptional regulator
MVSCLRLAAQGLTTAQIGASLGISGRTVEEYFEDAYRRLGVRGRTQAVARAVQLNLI